MGLLERYTQGNRLLQIHSPLGDNTLLMTDIHSQDSLSSPFEFTLICLSEEPGLPAQDLVGQAVDFGYELNHGSVRYFNGYVARLSNLGRASVSLYRYRLTIGNNRQESVGANETIDIGADRTESVGGNESITIAKEQSIDIGKSRTENVGKNETITIGMNKAETITLAKALSIDAAYQITVGTAKN